MTENQEYYRTLYTIRRFEQTVLENISKGVFHGTTHTYLGQEANAAGVLSQIQEGDIVFSNHRCHGHFLAYGGNMRALFAEMMGKITGICGGRGGSQHLHWNNFYSNGVQGGIVPIATGMALAEKRKGTKAIAACFLGDGTLGQGVVYEALNMASLWQIPILFVLENNHIAQTTPTGLALSGSAIDRFRAFKISTIEMDTSDVVEISTVAADLMDDVRREKNPRALILNTSRFGPHSKGDDTRDDKVVARLKKMRDPIKIHAPRLSDENRESIEEEVDTQISDAFQQALDDPSTKLTESGVYYAETSHPKSFADEQSETVLKSINTALHHVMEIDENVIILGEDILDPYGGAFKITQGLSTKYPDRVITTPISEAGIVGVAAGMAMRGLHPVVEIMFGDFTTLIADQIINHLAKFRWMYNDQVRVPVVIRTPMGGRRGYGPTHSQTMEKYFLGVPGLKILAPNSLGNPGELLETAIVSENDPVLFVENKLQYLLPIQDAESSNEFSIILEIGIWGYPTYTLSIDGAPESHITIAAYGHMSDLAKEAIQELAFEYEIFAELVVPTQLAPVDMAGILKSARKTGKLLVVEEGTLTAGWGAEVLARTAESLGSRLLRAQRVAARDIPIPASKSLEEAVLPDVIDIIQAVQKMV
jgi:2-oxoisovalerate dehydrogenase E1 component